VKFKLLYLILGFLLLLPQTSYAKPFHAKTVNGFGYEDAYCLAQNIYFESRNQSKLGQIAVSLVVIARYLNDYYPDSICGVIKQGSLSTGEIYSIFKKDGKTVKIPSCQFSWYCDGISDKPPRQDLFEEYMGLAWYILGHKSIWGLIDYADHYHAANITPSWAGTTVRYKITQIDSQVFWKQ